MYYIYRRDNAMIQIRIKSLLLFINGIMVGLLIPYALNFLSWYI